MMYKYKRLLFLSVTTLFVLLMLLLYCSGNIAHVRNPLNAAFRMISNHNDGQTGENTDTSSLNLVKDYLTEEEALHGSPLTDINKTVSLTFSDVHLVEKRSVYQTGEEIKLHVTLRNGYRVSRRQGGDQLRVRIYNTPLNAYAPGYVIDHDNGTYTAVVRAIWPGKQNISVTLAYTRETVRVVYYLRKKLPSTRTVAAGFRYKKMAEETDCHPNRTWLGQYKALCDFTLNNGGAPWFCGKPSNTVLLCEDWTEVKLKMPYVNFPLTIAESSLLRGPRPSFPDIPVEVKGNMSIHQNLLACNTYPRQDLWTESRPTGYFYNNTWKLHHCNGPSGNDFKECLRDTRLLITGDSTTRPWYSFLCKTLSCTQTTESWTTAKWHKRSTCYNSSYNLTIQWLPHAQPFFSFPDDRWDTYKYTVGSITRHINELDSNIKAIIVIHMYVHLAAFHHSVFRERIRLVSNSIRLYLIRNKNAKILIKGPHTYATTSIGNDCMSDYIGYLYRDIMFEEFQGLHERVTYMDQKDMTIAKNVYSHHPPDEVIRGAVYQMLGYICG